MPVGEHRQDGHDRRERALEAGQPQEHARGDVGHAFPPFQHAPQGPRRGRDHGDGQGVRPASPILSRPRASRRSTGPSRPSLFVFNDHISLVEFARTLENRELEASDTGTANFGTQEPYIAVVDPLGGREEPPASTHARRHGRGGLTTRRGATSGAWPECWPSRWRWGSSRTREYAQAGSAWASVAYFAAALTRRAPTCIDSGARQPPSTSKAGPSRANDAPGRSAQDRRHPRHRLRLRRLDHAPSPGPAVLPRLCAAA